MIQRKDTSGWLHLKDRTIPIQEYRPLFPTPREKLRELMSVFESIRDDRPTLIESKP